MDVPTSARIGKFRPASAEIFARGGMETFGWKHWAESRIPIRKYYYDVSSDISARREPPILAEFFRRDPNSQPRVSLVINERFYRSFPLRYSNDLQLLDDVAIERRLHLPAYRRDHLFAREIQTTVKRHFN